MTLWVPSLGSVQPASTSLARHQVALELQPRTSREGKAAAVTEQGVAAALDQYEGGESSNESDAEQSPLVGRGPVSTSLHKWRGYHVT